MKKGLGFKLFLVCVIVVTLGLFSYYDLGRYLSLASLKEQLDTLKDYYGKHRLLTMAVYMAVYIVATALSLPGAVILTLAGGAVFGLFYGLILVSFASTIGATLAFLFSRYMFKDWVQQKFSARLLAVNKGIEQDGGLYLFTLRLVPVFPFFVINLVMGLTPIKTSVYYLVSQAGMLPGTVVFINAGTQLAKLESVSGILSPNIIFSFVLLGVFPLIAKRVTEVIRKKKIYSKFIKPKSFDYNMVVIGAGSAGLVASYIASAVKAKVALIEAHKMGGDCLNTGCVPSKALIASARLLSHVQRAKEFGFESGSLEFDFSTVMERVQSKIKLVEPHDSVERYTGLGVDCFTGNARVISPFEVEINGQILTTRNIIVATGARPMIPNIPGLEKVDYLTSDTIWDIREQPKNLVILGAGPIGCEMAQAFARLGSSVTMVQRHAQIMDREDLDAADIVAGRFRQEGITLLLNHTAKRVEVSGDKKTLICEHDGQEIQVLFDSILLALGRIPNVAGFGLEELGVVLGQRNNIETNDFLQTNFPNIYCSGDVHGRYQFTHTAAHESWYASVNALFGSFKKFRVDYRVIPWTTFTDPEVARVGLNEKDAEQAGIEYEMVKYGLADLDRAIADSQDHGFVKVLTIPGKDKILGVTIVGNHAADILAEFVLAMKHGLGLNKILGTIHIYPTMAEANKYAAGLWKKTHAPKKLLAWVEKYHAWMRN
ncbi:MAG: FAD-dependent oxidoreductase [Pseudomonadota bacterium]